MTDPCEMCLNEAADKGETTCTACREYAEWLDAMTPAERREEEASIARYVEESEGRVWG